MNFYGQVNLKVTEGNRLVLPVQFRAEFATELYLSSLFEGWMEVYSQKTLTEVILQIKSAKALTSSRREFDRLFFSHLRKLTLDSQSRFILEEKEISKYNLSQGSEALLIGADLRIEIWSEKNWELKKLQYRKNSEIERIFNRVAIQ